MSRDSTQILKDGGERKRLAEKTEAKKVKWGDGAALAVGAANQGGFASGLILSAFPRWHPFRQ